MLDKLLFYNFLFLILFAIYIFAISELLPNKCDWVVICFGIVYCGMNVYLAIKGDRR